MPWPICCVLASLFILISPLVGADDLSCNDLSLKPIWFTGVPAEGYHGTEFTRCIVPAVSRNGSGDVRPVLLRYSVQNTFNFTYEDHGWQIPLRVDQNDLQRALEASIQEFRQQALATNNSFIPAVQPGALVHYNQTFGRAALQYLGYPCDGHLPGVPSYSDPDITGIRYNDLALLFQAIQALLRNRDRWTAINAGIVQFAFPKPGAPWNLLNFGLLEMLDSRVEWRSLENVLIRSNYTCNAARRDVSQPQTFKKRGWHYDAAARALL